MMESPRQYVYISLKKSKKIGSVGKDRNRYNFIMHRILRISG